MELHDHLNRTAALDAAGLTPWFPDDVKPVHVGVYQRMPPIGIGPLYSRWDGSGWWQGSLDLSEAMSQRHDRSVMGAPWRGRLE
jgi:hypothetical protein